MSDRSSQPHSDYKEPTINSNGPGFIPLTRARSFSASDSDQFKDLMIEKPKSNSDGTHHTALYPGTNTPQQKSQSRKRAFSDTEIGELVDILKDYQDFTPLKEKRDIISTRLKRHKIIQKEIANLTSEISSVKIEKEDAMNL